MDAVLKAIAEPRRQEILRLIWAEELTAGEVAAHFDVSRPNISKHLRILRESGLAEERRDGTRRLYPRPARAPGRGAILPGELLGSEPGHDLTASARGRAPRLVRFRPGGLPVQ